MSTHTGYFIQPELPQVVRDMSYCYEKAEAVSWWIQLNMRRAIGRGKGTNAARRVARMEAEFQAAQDALADQMAATEDNFQQQPN